MARSSYYNGVGIGGDGDGIGRDDENLDGFGGKTIAIAHIYRVSGVLGRGRDRVVRRWVVQKLAWRPSIGPIGVAVRVERHGLAGADGKHIVERGQVWDVHVEIFGESLRTTARRGL